MKLYHIFFSGAWALSLAAGYMLFCKYVLTPEKDPISYLFVMALLNVLVGWYYFRKKE